MQPTTIQAMSAGKTRIHPFQWVLGPCSHRLTGRTEAPKICIHNYACYHCPFDQMLDDMDLAPDACAAGRPLAN